MKLTICAPFNPRSCVLIFFDLAVKGAWTFVLKIDQFGLICTKSK